MGAPPVDDDELGLTQRLHTAVEQFEALAAAAGLPWLDKAMYRNELISGASVSALPRIERLNALLSHQVRVTEDILSHHKRREELIYRLLMTCAFDHAHQECSHDSHRAVCDTLRHVDDETDKLIHLVEQWRKHLAVPLPFFVDGENIILRMGNQTSIGKGLAHVGAHLRNTCRHLPYFYSSSYDPAMVESNKVLQRRELDVLKEELDIQFNQLQEALRLARMGMYSPVLRFRHQPTMVSRPILMIDNKRWKAQLIVSFANGLSALAKTRPVADNGITSAMMQFAGVASKVLHRRYFYLWYEFRKKRVERKRTVLGMALMADMMLLQRYMENWRGRMGRVKVMRGHSDALLAMSCNVLRRRYMQKLFLKAATKRAERLVKRAMCLRYFRHLQYRAVVTILHRRPVKRVPTPWLEAMCILGGPGAADLTALNNAAIRSLPPHVDGEKATT